MTITIANARANARANAKLQIDSNALSFGLPFVPLCDQTAQIRCWLDDRTTQIRRRYELVWTTVRSIGRPNVPNTAFFGTTDLRLCDQENQIWRRLCDRSFDKATKRHKIRYQLELVRTTARLIRRPNNANTVMFWSCLFNRLVDWSTNQLKYNVFLSSVADQTTQILWCLELYVAVRPFGWP